MCVRPLIVKVNNIHGAYTVNVPCGHCAECLKSIQNEWLVRLYHQFRATPKAVFVTLTYNESSVPTVFNELTGEAWLSVCKRHIQLCLKRYRRYLDVNYTSFDRPTFKYFITSEYGPRTKRPHYHGIFFGVSRKELLPFLLDWQKSYGFVNASDIECSTSHHQKSARYVSKYCTKGMFENPLVEMGLVEPTFHLISKGIGALYVAQMRDFHLAKDTVFYRPGVLYTNDYLDQVLSRLRCLLPNGRGYNSSSSGSGESDYFSYRLPKYYKEKIFSISSGNEMYFLKAALARRLCEVHDEVHNRQLDELQALWNCSRDEAEHICIMQNFTASECRDREAFEALGRFFDKSTL